jgi:hypothetical protein
LKRFILKHGQKENAASLPMQYNCIFIQLTSNLGRVNIFWESTLGEKGSLQSPMVTRPFVPKKDIEFEALDLPPVMRLDNIYNIKMRITNNSELDVALKLEAMPEVMEGVKVHGKSAQVMHYKT